MSELPLSAGVLLYRTVRSAGLEILLGHKGGPFWAGRDRQAWSIPKGRCEEGESAVDTALREFREEMGVDPPSGGWLDLGVSVGQQKLVQIFACEGEFDVELAKSNECEIEWPVGSGELLRIEEMDRAAWVDASAAVDLLSPPQEVFPQRLVERLSIRNEPLSGGAGA